MQKFSRSLFSASCCARLSLFTLKPIAKVVNWQYGILPRCLPVICTKGVPRVFLTAVSLSSQIFPTEETLPPSRRKTRWGTFLVKWIPCPPFLLLRFQAYTSIKTIIQSPYLAFHDTEPAGLFFPDTFVSRIRMGFLSPSQKFNGSRTIQLTY